VVSKSELVSNIPRTPDKEDLIDSAQRMQDARWMQRALDCARQACLAGEVPVGAVMVRHGRLVGEGFNQSISAHDPTAHAEILAIRSAAKKIGNYRLPETTLYVTIEPCIMCLGALVHARVERLVFGALEPKAGAVKTHPMTDGHFLNHKIDWSCGILGSECGQLMRDFFLSRRKS